MSDTSQAMARVVEFYETLSPASLARIAEVYAADARFTDPFNEVCGVPAIEKVFRHMYEQVQAPCFRVIHRMAEGDEAWLAWEFQFHFRGWKEAELQCIRGATHLRFAADGRVMAHRDYWDSGEELYSRLPLVGTLVSWLRRRMSAA